MMNTDNKIAILLRQPRKLFHTHDLELLWGIHNKNTLYSTINRYLKKGILIQIYRGFYTIADLKNISIYELGTSAIHEYCYVSTETILAQNGVIFQLIPHTTFCGPTKKRITIGDHSIICRKLADTFLYNKTGIIERNGFKEATSERAIADLMHYNPHYYFDATDFIDWKAVKNLQQEMGYI